MRTRFLITMLAGLAFCQPLLLQAAMPPNKPALPNYDKRKVAGGTAPASLAVTNARQDAAVTALQSRLPAARVSKDSILGAPRNVRAAQGFLSGPGGKGGSISATALQALPADDAHRLVKAFLNEYSDLFGVDAQALEGARVQRDYVTEHNGLHTTVWQQTIADIPVFEGLLVSHVTRKDELVSLSSKFIPESTRVAAAAAPRQKALVARPAVSSVQAIAAAAANVGAEVKEDSIKQVEAAQGAENRQTMQAEGLLGRISSQYVWLPMDRDSVRLCWRVILGVQSSLEHYLILVDAETGEVLVRQSLTAHISDASYNVFTSDSPSPFTPGWPTPNSEQPALTERTLVTLGALDETASPDGWVNDGNSPLTQGNNADAFLWRKLDYDANGYPLPDRPRPNGGTNRVFHFPMDLTNQAPLAYADASTVQLFYRANWYHDRLYQLGFTEAAGNFQRSNFGRGGLGNDAIYCLVQAAADYGYEDNSMFYTPPDGTPGECYMFVFNGPHPSRDGSLDQEVVVHELTHGLSGRLVGGGVGISQLQTEGLGEGWSDFYSLCLLSEPSDDVNANYAEGGYVTYLFGQSYVGFSFTENYYYGIRRYPYTTDMSKNPLTFKDIDPSQADLHIGVPISPLIGGGDPAEVHNQGEVWCATLWEVRVNLVKKHGWAVGNELALQLVTDGMKLCPANPTFLDARDAIFQADEINHDGENAAELWAGFAKRGMGLSAFCPPSDTTIGVVEAFDKPEPDGILEIQVKPASFNVLFSGEVVPIFIRVTDVYPVTNATITATIVGSTNLPVVNDGSGADVRPHDSTYTAQLIVPSMTGTLTINMVISAPEKDTVTNTCTYYVVPPPPNDDFANSTKVPVKGASYLTSNSRATLQPGEPSHASIVTAARSLWWDYVPSADTNVLVDTSGSGFRTVIAVYTNNTLRTANQPVVSAVGSVTRLGAFLYIPAKAGVPYHIAVAGYNTNSGLLRLTVGPSSRPDTNAPVVTIETPPSGLVVTTNRLLVTGTAVDQGAEPTGIKAITVRVSSIVGVGQVHTTVINPMSSLIGPLTTNWSTVVGLFQGENQIQVVATDFAENNSTPVSVQATYRVIDPPNDFFVLAMPLPMTDSGVSSINTISATKEVGEPVHAGISGGRSAWWSFCPVADGVLTLSTTNSTFDTLLAVYTGANVAHVTPVAANDDAYDGAPGGFSMISQALKVGTTNYIALDGYAGAGGNAVLHYSFTPSTVYLLTVTSTSGGSAQVTSSNELGGAMLMPRVSGYFAANSKVALTASPETHYQFSSWSGGVNSSVNPLTVTIGGDLSISASFSPVVVSDGFESGNLLHQSWITGGPTVGNAPWIVQTNVVSTGQWAARSGVITNNQTSSLVLTTNFHAGVGSFDYRVSSEEDWDWLEFHVDGALLQHWTGEVDWANYLFSLSTGTHTLEWRYVKDAMGSGGSDAAFLDNMDLPLGQAIGASTPAVLSLSQQLDGSFILNLAGQTNLTYIVQVSDNLTSWESISTNIAVNGRAQVPVANSGGTRFYRAFVPAP